MCIAAVTATVVNAEPKKGKSGDPIQNNALRMLEEGKQTFRFDTFGDEAFWGDTLKLHQAIAGSKLGGVGDGVSPKTALAVGLKVDMDALPKDLVKNLKAGKVNLDDPATTLALLKLNSVVGVKGFFDEKGTLKSMGITCAFCHSTVDNAFVPESVIAWTAGQTAISMWVSLHRSLPTLIPLPSVCIRTWRR